MQKKKTVILSVTNDLVGDQRVHKVATTLLNNSFNVILVGRKLKNSSEIKRDYKTVRFNLLFNKGFLFYANYNLRLFFYLLFTKFDILNSNDLDSLLANYLVAKIKGKKIVYDSHEFFTQVPELVNRPKVQNIWLKLEKWILPKLKYTYTVSPPIAEEYKKLCNIDMKLIRNLPFLTKVEKTIIKEDKFIIYQGALNIGRGLENMIIAMKSIDAKLMIIGGGDIETELKQLSIENNLDNKVIFKGKLPFNKLSEYTQKATIGVSLEEPEGLNYKYALPNKIFDYINAEIPLLVSNLPEMAQIVKQYEVGEILKENTSKAIAEKINNLLDNSELYNSYISNTVKAKQELCWETQEKDLLELYK